MRIGVVSLCVSVGRLISRRRVAWAVWCLGNVTACRLLVCGGVYVSCHTCRIIRLRITVLLRICVASRISGVLWLGISVLSVSVLCIRSLSGIIVVFRHACSRLACRNLGRLVSPLRLITLHLGISGCLWISLGILVILRILISLLCRISRVGCSARIIPLQITVLLRISTLIGILIFLSHIFSFPLQAVIVAL